MLHTARAKLLRRSSAVSGSSQSTKTDTSAETDGSAGVPPLDAARPRSVRKSSLPRLLRRLSKTGPHVDSPDPIHKRRALSHRSVSSTPALSRSCGPTSAPRENLPSVIIEAPSPVHVATPDVATDAPPATGDPPSPRKRPVLVRNPTDQSRELVPTRSAEIRPSSPIILPSRSIEESDRQDTTFETAPKMGRRRIWVKRPNASATLVKINEDDFVDEVRDMIISKYANSLGRNFDAPDVTLRIIPRERTVPERVLGPEEEMCKTLDAYFPGGQSVEEALVIDVPTRKTPRPSPRMMLPAQHYFEDQRPAEEAGEYFPLMPATSPGHTHSLNSQGSRHSYQNAPHAIAILNTGQVPPLPSPGARNNRDPRRASHRPPMARQPTSSPTIVTTSAKSNANGARPTRPRQNSGSDRAHTVPNPPNLPTPPLSDIPGAGIATKASTPPIDTRVTNGRAAKVKRGGRRPNGTSQLHEDNSADSQRSANPLAGLLDNSVPPINVLIVEDNIINLKLLEQLARRLKVRWSTAMNGRDAVAKWRTGGFHLVLMDIQLPIMSGLDATKEIRRLERVNGIGVFAKSENDMDRRDSLAILPLNQALPKSSDATTNGESPKDTDKLDLGGVFKSPVIIVALTASSLQSDRHEALAAGCNDFLTKPVNFVWFERKVMEWGCMQALIDFDGWRQWKSAAAEAEKLRLEKEANKSAGQRKKREKKEAARLAQLEENDSGTA